MRDMSKSAVFPKDWFRDGENGERAVVSVSQDVFCDDGVSGSPWIAVSVWALVAARKGPDP